MDNRARHVALIMDGNGRWAQAHGYDRLRGHSQGVEALRRVVRAATDTDVEYLTVYAFSTENWGRPQSEVEGLMELLASTILLEAEPLAKAGVRLDFLGDTQALPVRLRENIEAARCIAIDKVRLNLIVALNYSSRGDILSAVNSLIKDGVSGVDEDMFARRLSTSALPEVDLLIRTSGEQRLSNFLLWELSYAEIYFTQVLWPDFDENEFHAALEWFASRQRRFGKL